MGQEADYYGLQGCQRWAKRTYCELQNSLQQYTDLIELTTELREKGKLFRKRRKIQKTLPGYEDLIFGCYNEYSTAREDFVVDCNEFDYYPEPEDNFDAETLQRNNLNKDN